MAALQTQNGQLQNNIGVGNSRRIFSVYSFSYLSQNSLGPKILTQLTTKMQMGILKLNAVFKHVNCDRVGFFSAKSRKSTGY